MKVVCFGDSLTARTEGWDRPLLSIMLEAKLGTDWDVVNAGVPGNNTFHALERVEKDVLIHEPDLVTVFFGSNDAAFNKMVPLPDFKSKLTEVVTIIGPKRVILISPAPVDESLQEFRTNDVLQQYADVVWEVSEETGSHYLDFFARIMSLPNRNEVLRGQRNDGLHFGELGYEVLSDEISRKIEEIGSFTK
ncbi:lysophospholipase L1-like esterase [Cytobacillus firmus]|uniref:Lysophospholipase L1-like esterase n=2 Tax=Cytobacillus TaxID=2675230 RepID=A0A366JE28_CYTFI|nr:MULTISPECIES: GDSL-type esterase/lipase family protein [Cytobacillus]RBP84524.1 lysophospholipase L1-like esterase [Cytobacillus firmus]TDX34571.1 lysophospholipase L1-like esterase [Cytobacillus oceanisediminis]